jgi:hypothetical protein
VNNTLSSELLLSISLYFVTLIASAKLIKISLMQTNVLSVVFFNTAFFAMRFRQSMQTDDKILSEQLFMYKHRNVFERRRKSVGMLNCFNTTEGCLNHDLLD